MPPRRERGPKTRYPKKPPKWLTSWLNSPPSPSLLAKLFGRIFAMALSLHPLLRLARPQPRNAARSTRNQAKPRSMGKRAQEPARAYPQTPRARGRVPPRRERGQDAPSMYTWCTPPPDRPSISPRDLCHHLPRLGPRRSPERLAGGEAPEDTARACGGEDEGRILRAATGRVDIPTFPKLLRDRVLLVS